MLKNKNKTSISFQCPLCNHPYDTKSHTPIIICLNKHCYCYDCTVKLIFKNSSLQSFCPQCKIRIRKQKIQIFQYLDFIKQNANNIEQNISGKIDKTQFNVSQLWEELGKQKLITKWLLRQCQQKDAKISKLCKALTQIQRIKINQIQLYKKVQKYQLEIHQLKQSNQNDKKKQKINQKNNYCRYFSVIFLVVLFVQAYYYFFSDHFLIDKTTQPYNFGQKTKPSKPIGQQFKINRIDQEQQTRRIIQERLKLIQDKFKNSL